MNKLENLKISLENQINNAETALRVWEKQFKSNPVYALKWSKETFQNAALIQEFKLQIEAIDWYINQPDEFSDDLAFKEIRTLLQNGVNLLASKEENSSSPTHNLIDRYQLKAQASILKMIQYI